MKRRRWHLPGAVHSAVLNLSPEPELLWSKGIGAFCDFAGPRSYRLAPTESTQTEAFFLRHFRGAHGVVWVRLSTLSRVRHPCDLDTFARVVLPTIEAPFTLLTTDGDASAPSDFARETVDRLLASPFLVSWYTQNRDGDDPRIKPFPIGLDLHTPRLPATPAGLVKTLMTIRARRTPAANAPLKVFCDLAINTNSLERRELLVQDLGGVGAGGQEAGDVTEADERIVLQHHLPALREADHTEVDGVEHFADELLLAKRLPVGRGHADGLAVEQASLRAVSARRRVAGRADGDDDDRQEHDRVRAAGRGAGREHHPVHGGDAEGLGHPHALRALAGALRADDEQSRSSHRSSPS